MKDSAWALLSLMLDSKSELTRTKGSCEVITFSRMLWFTNEMASSDLNLNVLNKCFSSKAARLLRMYP